MQREREEEREHKGEREEGGREREREKGRGERGRGEGEGEGGEGGGTIFESNTSAARNRDTLSFRRNYPPRTAQHAKFCWAEINVMGWRKCAGSS